MRWIATLAALMAAVGLSGAQPPPDHAAQAVGVKVCIYEPQKTTKTAYTSVCKEYCAADYSPLAILKRCCGLSGCDGPCPPLPLVKTVLVKKAVPGPDKMACVLKELPAVIAPPAN
ncbi:hypothetical protein [Urbifossiella limnaea]|uniref:Uncharacterized protein n=1 Tax=Urbifossiella limnaea TaxID=2528023 RepID=A0A517XPM4_9BACT|nr:hypothetical protein [Urbifossiella limnaea]QDU19459.1 hypothetical protein ETAA1_13840 [Urbifossiella limnaea]